jgi:N-acetylglucosaminyl-diphospho-decaprenol L-rhamnosyltransferase
MLSIVVVSYNTCELLRNCLASLQRHAPTAQVIVVDNASRDGSVPMVRTEFPTAEVVALTNNLGFAAANNAGLRLAAGDPIVLLNSDTVVEDDSLDRCAAWMQVHPRVGASSPRLVGVDDRPQQCLHPFPTLAEVLRVTFRHAEGVSNRRVADGWLAGTALFLRREALRQIGGELDPGYFMYWEDADLSARLRERGWERVAYAEGHVRHYGGASSAAAAAPVRDELLAWYAFGRHRWFARHRPALEAVALWLLDALDVPRILLRGWRRRLPATRTRAWVLLKVLVWRLTGQAPPHPQKANAGMQT